MPRGVYIVGEDPVTLAIIQRIIKDYAPHLNIIQSLPARGSQIKSKIGSFNTVANSSPVILLTDLDTDPCAPMAKANLLKGLSSVSPEFVINVAVDEAEAWLLADRDGFSTYFGIPLDHMPQASPQKMMGRNPRIEVEVPLKSSYYITHNLITSSSKATLKQQIFAEDSCKGKEYNSAMLPFVSDVWNVENARQFSYSLNGMILRIQQIAP